jgi:hypothetical protein
MAEYVEREALRNLMNFGVTDLILTDGKLFVNFENVRNAVEGAPCVEVVHGEWLRMVNEHNYFEYHCPLCGRIEKKEEPYCHCGAKMDLNKEKNNGRINY